MNLPHKRWTKAIFISAVASVLSGCASTPQANPGDKMSGVDIASEGQKILFSWNLNAPVASRVGNGSRLELVASYQSDLGPVTGEVIAKAQPDSRFNGVNFELPKRLKFIPTGPICLRVSDQRSAIPLRVPMFGETNDGFLHPEWESQTAINTERAVISEKLESVQKARKMFSSTDNEFETWKRSKGLTSASQCETLTATSNSSRPLSALTGQAKVNAARNQCVRQFHEFTDQLLVIRPYLTHKVLAAELLDKLPQGHRLRSTATGLIRDIDTYGIGRKYLTASELGIDSTTFAAINAANGRISTVAASAIVESYQACLSEAEGRMQQSYESWMNQTSQSTIEARSEPIRQECRLRFSIEGQRTGELNKLDMAVIRLQSQLNALPQARGTLTSSNREIYRNACPLEAGTI